LGRAHPRAFGERGSGPLAFTLEPRPLGLQGRDFGQQLDNLVSLRKDQLHQVVVAQGGQRGRQTHRADCMLAGQLPQVAHQLPLGNNASGRYSTAVGFAALANSKSGKDNTALGAVALQNYTTGTGTIAVGASAGVRLQSGEQNIYLGNDGVLGETNTMRLGYKGYANFFTTRTFIAGVYNAALNSGSPKAVYVNSSGQVGFLASSARYKRDIRDMREGSQGLYHLRPVTFRYKQDAQGQQQYGLIAEEVAKVYPELVTKRADGKVESVQYHELIPMLLNEVQRQQQTLAAQAQEIAELKAQAHEVAELRARLERMEARDARTASVSTR
jgi:hypothetical protein